MKLPSTRHLERLATPSPSPEELTLEHLEHIDIDSLALVADDQLDRDCRYAQKVGKRRKKLLEWGLRRLSRDARITVKLSLMGKTQREIAEVLGISQPTALVRLRQAQRRLVWLCNYGARLNEADIRAGTKHILRQKDLQILCLWWKLGSQSEVARVLFGDVSRQTHVRDSLIHSLTVIKNARGLSKMSETLESLWETKVLRVSVGSGRRPRAA